MYSASIDFIRYLALVKFTRNQDCFPETLLVIRLGLIINIFISLIAHLDYSLIETELLITQYSTITKTINVLTTLALMGPFIMSIVFNDKRGEGNYGLR